MITGIRAVATPPKWGQLRPSFSYVHEAHGYARPSRHPMVAAALAGAARTVGEEQRRAAPVTLDLLRQMCARRFVLSDAAQRTERSSRSAGRLLCAARRS